MNLGSSPDESIVSTMSTMALSAFCHSSSSPSLSSGTALSSSLGTSRSRTCAWSSSILTTFESSGSMTDGRRGANAIERGLWLRDGGLDCAPAPTRRGRAPGGGCPGGSVAVDGDGPGRGPPIGPPPPAAGPGRGPPIGPPPPAAGAGDPDGPDRGGGDVRGTGRVGPTGAR